MWKKILCPFFVLFLATAGIGFALPDLEVTEVRLDGQCRVVATVKNNGSAISQEDFENSICYIVKSGSSAMSELRNFDPQKKLMAPGGILTKTIVSSPINAANVKLEMDANNAIAESNENNNELWQNLTCPTYHPEEYGDPLIAVNDFWLHDDCSVEVELENKGPKSLPPSAYSTSGSRLVLGISWANVCRANTNLQEVDPSHILQAEGGKIKYVIQSSRLNKTFRNTNVKVYTYYPNRPGHLHEKEKVLLCMPDLTVTDIKHKPAHLKTNERMWFKATVKNIGQISAPPCKLTFKIGGESSPPTYAVHALGPGQETYINREGNLSRKGNYRITATVDTANEVEEYREGNNKKWISVRVTEPKLPCDLTIEDIYVNNECYVVVKVKNIGAGAVPDKVWTTQSANNTSIHLYRGGNSWGGAQIRVIDLQRALQPPGGVFIYTTPLKVGANTQIKATIDHTNRVREENEQNNSMTKVVSCTPPVRMFQKTLPRKK